MPVDQIAKCRPIALPGTFDQLGIGHTVYRQSSGAGGWDGGEVLVLDGPDERLHVGEVLFERTPAGRVQAVLGSRYPAIERLVAGDVLGFFQLSGMDAQVAVCRVQEPLEVVERQPLVNCQGADDAQSQALVDEPIEIERARFGASRTGRDLFLARAGPTAGERLATSNRSCFSHRTSSQSEIRTQCEGRRIRPPERDDPTPPAQR